MLSPQPRRFTTPLPAVSGPTDPLDMRANNHFTLSEIYTITRDAARSLRSLSRFKKPHGKPFPSGSCWP